MRTRCDGAVIDDEPRARARHAHVGHASVAVGFDVGGEINYGLHDHVPGAKRQAATFAGGARR